MKKTKTIVYTIGHSTRTLADFINILQTFNIQKVVDIRTIPRSRHNPQFNETHLKKILPKHTIGYIHLAALGGLRHAHADSVNMGWHNASFRGYANYMQTDEFKKAIEKLIALAEKNRLLSCALRRCHGIVIAHSLEMLYWYAMLMSKIFIPYQPSNHTNLPCLQKCAAQLSPILQNLKVLGMQ